MGFSFLCFVIQRLIINIDCILCWCIQDIEFVWEWQLVELLINNCSMAEMIGPRLYSCCNCRNQIALHDDVISKSFQGRNGRAILFSHAMNIMIGPKEDRQLMTGLHTVADVYCCDCREVLGWKYERAFEETQKYKEGKFILEKSKIVIENW
ncbi:protein yippee-like At4g27745 isoform X1 [Hibiscus syriacus]|nr:protein yippee-like At4g27745 isoform X1 [Hibiscus syriacus]